MGYTRAPQELGLSWDDVAQAASNIWNKAGPVLEAGVAVVNDPYLPQVACEVMRLQAIQAKRPPGPPCPSPKNPGNKGVGLQYVVKPLKAFVYLRQHPWILPAGAAAAVGLIFAVGYAAGRRRSK